MHYLNLIHMAGYSEKALIAKLGLKPVMKVLLKNEPDDYAELLGCDISSQLTAESEQPDFVHWFIKKQHELEEELNDLLIRIHPETIIWVSWYKKASKIPTDVTEDSIRNLILKTDLVDVKVCAVSDIWSGLKLVIRKARRKK